MDSNILTKPLFHLGHVSNACDKHPSTDHFALPSSTHLRHEGNVSKSSFQRIPPVLFGFRLDNVAK